MVAKGWGGDGRRLNGDPTSGIMALGWERNADDTGLDGMIELDRYAVAESCTACRLAETRPTSCSVWDGPTRL